MDDGGDSKFLRDSYLEWCAAQPVPVIEEFGINVMTIDMEPWDFFGMKGAVCLLEGRDDFTSIFGFELPPGAKSRPLRHIYGDVVCILSGHGSTVIDTLAVVAQPSSSVTVRVTTVVPSGRFTVGLTPPELPPVQVQA